MAKLPPDNLGKRQYDLNTKVNEAFAKKVKIEDVKDESAVSEVDNFFKIDLAAKCRNVDYIMDVLKSGETLYAHRALKKCSWIYGPEYTDFINPEYLHTNIFPVTSMRVKLMILKEVAMQVRDENRAEAFHHYCMENKMPDIALKCLLFTNDQFKLSFMQKQNDNFIRKKFSYIRFIIGKSFDLLDAFIKLQTNNQERTLNKFRYLYTANNIKYLDLLEKYTQVYDRYIYDCLTNVLDEKLCDDILKKHKHRLFNKPLLYLNKIPPEIIARNITAEEAKILIVTVLPQSAAAFWDEWFCNRNKSFINLLPKSEIYDFLKKIFHDKYPHDEFETHWCFHQQRYFEFMTVEQQEKWALNHVESDKQILGVGKDYLWYKFVNFECAFEEVKKFVIITKEPEKRCQMLVTLVQSVRKNRELEELFKHYYKRHVNEPKKERIYFLDEVIHNQNVYEFDEACWDSFYTLLLSVEPYTTPRFDPCVDYPLENYKTIMLFYHILHNKKMPEELMVFFLDEFFPRVDSGYGTGTIFHHLQKLTDERQTILFEYLYTFYSDRINEFKNEPRTNVGMRKANRYFSVMLQLVRVCNVKPAVYKREPKPQKQRKTRVINTNISDKQLLRELKKDKNLVVEKLSEVKTRLEHNNPIEIRNLLRKIKIYFKHDLTETFLDMFKELTSKELGAKSVESCVNAIFELGNEGEKIDLMQKYAPENDKLDFIKLDAHLLNIQRAICKNASNSLPPVPLEIMLAYMKGDYVQYCLHLFSVYITALPMCKSISLVESMLDSPVSIQKHALRLAFQCFNAESLNIVSKKIWSKTKNVSLRSVIYNALFNRIVDKNESELHDILISFTLDLHDDDEKVIFGLIVKDTLPHDFLGEYKKATWKAVRLFKDKEPNIGWKTSVISGIRWNLHIMDKEFVKDIIYDHLDLTFNENKLELIYSNDILSPLYKEKWSLTVDYIVGNSCDGEEVSKYVELAQSIIKLCLNLWDEQRSGKNIFQKWCWEFIENMNTVSMEYHTHSEFLIPIYEGVLDVLQDVLPLHEIYMRKWEIELVIRNRRIIKDYRETFQRDSKRDVVVNSLVSFGKEVGKLLSEYVDNKMYFSSISRDIKILTYKRVEEILAIIFAGSDENSKDYLDDALTSIAVGLIEFEIVETYLLALALLPSGSTRSEYQLVVDKAKKFPHPEVHFTAHQKLTKSQN